MRGILKSQEEFYLRLHAQLIRDVPFEPTSLERKSFEKDISILRKRCLYEGLAFLTKTLPLLGKALDKSLVSGRFNIPREFKCSHENENRPAFLQVCFNRLFDDDGLLRDEVPVEIIRYLRQVLFFAYKLETPYSMSDNARVINSFIATESELGLSGDPLASEIISLAKIITRKVFHDFNHKDIHPQHGPGAVATGEKLDKKWEFSRLYDDIHQVFPYYDYYVVGGARELADRLEWYKSLRRLKSGQAKVVLVPKDSRGPRLISCEPLEYQWIQQGLGRKLSNFLEWISPYTRKHVNFEHQEINRNIAQASSASQVYATLDLKDASDRVSLELVRSVFERTPGLLRALEAARTTETKLPDGRVIHLEKFAPMGSALCFPVEAFLFWVIIVSAVIRGKNLPLEEVCKHVYVYGDDIIVPTAWASLSIQGLEAVGLKVNIDKSCFTGFFRESCGMDAYKGHSVTPLRLKKPWSGRNHDGSAYYSYVSLANRLGSQGYVSSSNLLWEELEKCYGKIPYGTFRSSFPCRVVTSPVQADSLNRDLFRRRVNRRYQRGEFFVLSLSLRRRKIKLTGWPRLLRDLVTPPFGDPSYMVVPLSMRIKRGWASVT